MLLCLAAGAAVTFAVAVAFAWHNARASPAARRVVMDAGDRLWAVWTFEASSPGRAYLSRFYGGPSSQIGPGESWSFTLAQPAGGPPPVALPGGTGIPDGAPDLYRKIRAAGGTSGLVAKAPIELRTGWPFAAVACWFNGVFGQPDSLQFDIPAFRVVGGVALPNADHRHLWAIPYTPLWAGFIADTLLYAAALWLLLAAIAAIRRRSRARRGLCRACGYPAPGNTTVCPECGAALAHPAAA
jgi:hypothetical protein